MRYQDVFVPGGFPRHTYNPRSELQLEQRLAEARDNLCKLVPVTGQTKSGKTVLARRVFPPEEAVWIDGGTVAVEDDFWQVIVEQLALFQSIDEETGSEAESKIGGKGTAEANFLIAKGTGEVSVELGKVSTKSTVSTQSLSSRVTALTGLRKNPVPIVIDDFHYLPRDMQGSIVRALKPLIFDGLPVVIIAIPHRRYDALKVEKEMTGRIAPIEIQAWSAEELGYIPVTGFTLLNYSLDATCTTRLAEEAIGSPHLMQDFCRSLCRQLQLHRAEVPAQLRVAEPEMEVVFKDVAETIGRPIFEKLARGPRQRTDRIERTLRDGRSVDIYELVLHGLAHIRPGLVSVEYEELRSAIRDVAGSQMPQLHEIARVLKHMATIAATDQSSTPVIDFEEEEKKLHVTDPFFAFYLRWGELVVPTDKSARQLRLE
ncbi:MAG: ATP-binding protein [Bryobacterales bacterium]|nr:ATP-binding protein [Bryobacterales bacterium]